MSSFTSCKKVELHLHLDGTLYSKNDPPPFLYIELKRLSEQYYRFQKSYLEHLQTGLNPFSDPIRVFNNIQNGVGVFAGASATLDSIRIN